MREPPVLEFRDVTRRWRAGILGAAHEVTALEGCSLSLRAGEILAVTGPAGSGKSTLLLLASGRVAPSAGEVRWSGANVAGAARPQLIGARPWEYHFLTVRQALSFHADVLALRDATLPAPTRYIPLMRRVGLRGMSRVRLGALGALDKLRVVVAQALLARPRLICLEEPFAYSGPTERAEGILLLRRLADDGLAVVVAGRDGDACGGQGTADRVLHLVEGRVQGSRAPRRRILELAVPSPDDALARLLPRLPSLARRGRRLRVPLRGTSPEAVLALCRDAGVQVRASRVAEEALPPPESVR
jgi:ABC-type multidrug transport system ATPase subunit